MLKLRCDDPTLVPEYKSEQAAGADLKSAESITIHPGEKLLIKTGVWIDQAASRNVFGKILVLKIYARSGLALKHGIVLANSVGIIDADYEDEICVILEHRGDVSYRIVKGERIAQIVQEVVTRIPGLPIGGKRLGGFGSSGMK